MLRECECAECRECGSEAFAFVCHGFKSGRTQGIEQAFHFSDGSDVWHIALIVEKYDRHIRERWLRCNLAEERTVFIHPRWLTIGDKQKHIRLG